MIKIVKVVREGIVGREVSASGIVRKCGQSVTAAQYWEVLRLVAGR